MKKSIGFVTSVLCAAVFMACAQAEITNGTYIGEGMGKNGPIQVEVKVENGKIANVTILKHQESIGISDPVFEIYPKVIVDTQQLNLDSVSGASATSQGVLAAVESALTKAGYQPSELQGKAPVLAKAPDEKLDAEVVVVGGGAAGMAALASALENGAQNVVLVEKQPMFGGSTGRSSGCVLHATDERDENNNFTPEDMFNFYMARTDCKANPELIKKIAENSKGTYEWVRDKGVVFYPSPQNYPGFASFNLENPDPNGAFARTNGMLIVNALKNFAEQNGAKLYNSTPVTELKVVDGKVVGVIAERPDGSKLDIDSKAVVLATGGYDHNVDLLKQYAPKLVGVITQTGSGNSGDGLLMGMKVGADTVFQYGKGGIVTVKVEPVQNPPKSFMYINGQGKRFVRETGFYDDIGRAMVDDPSQRFFRIYDSQENTEGLEKAAAEGRVLKADDLVDLAIQMRIDPKQFQKSVERYNNLKEDVDFGKNTALLTGIKKGPFYAVPAEPEVIGTFGGLKITPNGEVTKDGKPIPGLYAAGEVANGELYNDSYNYTGTAIQTALSTGKFAGKSAAETVKSTGK